jgi:hypothetical protein
MFRPAAYLEIPPIHQQASKDTQAAPPFSEERQMLPPIELGNKSVPIRMFTTNINSSSTMAFIKSMDDKVPDVLFHSIIVERQFLDIVNYTLLICRYMRPPNRLRSCASWRSRSHSLMWLDLTVYCRPKPLVSFNLVVSFFGKWFWSYKSTRLLG